MWLQATDVVQSWEVVYAHRCYRRAKSLGHRVVRKNAAQKRLNSLLSALPGPVTPQAWHTLLLVSYWPLARDTRSQ